MADTGKKVAEEATSDAASPNVTKENPRGGFLVKTVWPNVSFDMPDDDVPMITLDGTRLTKAQLDTAEKSAEAHGVELYVEEVK